METYRGNRAERVTTSEKRDVFQNLPEDFREMLQKEDGGEWNHTIKKFQLQKVLTNIIFKQVIILLFITTTTTTTLKAMKVNY